MSQLLWWDKRWWCHRHYYISRDSNKSATKRQQAKPLQRRQVTWTHLELTAVWSALALAISFNVALNLHNAYSIHKWSHTLVKRMLPIKTWSFHVSGFVLHLKLIGWAGFTDKGGTDSDTSQSGQKRVNHHISVTLFLTYIYGIYIIHTPILNYAAANTGLKFQPYLFSSSFSANTS